VTCDDARVLMHALLDDELDLANALEVQRHIEGDALNARANSKCLPRCAPGSRMLHCGSRLRLA
jgi:hypothetical protein